MTPKPLVSILCLCYNHEEFLEEALLSVISQDYPNKEIIVVDDFSTDHSVARIEKIIAAHPEICFIRNSLNKGNCISFNEAFKLSKGEFIIDFATDDVLLPGAISHQVEKFLSLPPNYGVVYSDAEVISEKGLFLGYHHKGTHRENFHPEGNIFKEILQRYFICPPTMMIRRAVLQKTGGYDSTLAYEDFNFWVESSREYFYAFIPEVLVKRRVVGNSLSLSFYSRKNPAVFKTTLDVLQKGFRLCNTSEEKQNCVNRIRFELRHAVMMEISEVPNEYKELLIKAGKYDWMSRIYLFISKYRIPVFWLYKILLNYKGVFDKR